MIRARFLYNFYNFYHDLNDIEIEVKNPILAQRIKLRDIKVMSTYVQYRFIDIPIYSFRECEVLGNKLWTSKIKN